MNPNYRHGGRCQAPPISTRGPYGTLAACHLNGVPYWPSRRARSSNFANGSPTLACEQPVSDCGPLRRHPNHGMIDNVLPLEPLHPPGHRPRPVEIPQHFVLHRITAKKPLRPRSPSSHVENEP